MIWQELAIPGVWLIQGRPEHDDRGSFARLWDREEASARGLHSYFAQEAVSTNVYAGTIRGLHYQREPFAETKLVRCSQGVLFDVIVELATGRVVTTILANPQTTLYVPSGCAHGFQTLTDASTVHYQMSAPYRPTEAAGIRWNDPSLKIQWPVPVSVMSYRDKCLPCLTTATATS